MRQTRAESGLGAKETSNTPKTGGRRARKTPPKWWLVIRETLMMVVVALAISAIHKSLPASGIPDSVLLHGTNPANQ